MDDFLGIYERYNKDIIDECEHGLIFRFDIHKKVKHVIVICRKIRLNFIIKKEDDKYLVIIPNPDF